MLKLWSKTGQTGQGHHKLC